MLQYCVDHSKRHSRQRDGTQIAKLACQKFKVRGHGDHGGVVGTVLQFGDKDVPLLVLCHLAKTISQTPVGRHAASDSNLPYACDVAGLVKAWYQHHCKLSLKTRAWNGRSV